ncbi:glycosyltransferase [Halomonas maura]|uniref:glycosyltransferase n=1 Tax=Halomonas maura TaxID=117606 RepID=UPI0025B4FCA5|nr:glycosyltransferase [Halomonas maura]MDN3555266.1 glycosyltransferase [Halomonas maura]
MRIVHVITSLYPGGAQSALCRLCTGDTRHRHTVIAMLGGGTLEETLRDHGVEVLSLSCSRLGGLLAGTVTLFRHLRRLRPDLVQTWMYHPDLVGGLCARLAGIRHVCWGIRHTALESGQSSRSSILAARLCAHLSGRVPDRIVCCAHEAAELHASLGYRADKLVVIANGYDLADFRPREDAAAQRTALLGADAGRPVLGMVGRFNAQKDHRNLLQALAEVQACGHDFLCLLVGARLDADNAELRGWIDERGLASRVRLLGLRSDIPQLMNALDLHVLSSAFGEGFPNVIAEAMACGTPCVGTAVGDTARIIDETGWVVPPRESTALAAAIQAALHERETQPARWAERRQACTRRIADHFTLERMVAAFDDVWSECLGDTPERTGRPWRKGRIGNNNRIAKERRS